MEKIKPKVIVTRAENQSASFINELERAGFEAICLPLIQTQLNSDLNALKLALDKLEQFDWIVFTSENAVRFFFDAAEAHGTKFYFYPNIKIATVGEKTKLKLEQLGYRTNFVPIKYTAEVLAANMDDLNGKKILIPRSSIAANDYVQVMKNRGASVLPIDLYHTEAIDYSEEKLKSIFSRQVDYLTFASPSAVDAFFANQSKFKIGLQAIKICCIGPSTAKKASALGYKVDFIATPHTVEGMIDELKKANSYVQT